MIMTRQRAWPILPFMRSSTGGRKARALSPGDADGVHEHKGMGLVPDVFDEADLQALTGAWL